MGEMTYEWRAPEIQDEKDPFDLPLQTRRLNNIWAYGTLLKKLASQVENGDPFAETIKLVADHLTQARCSNSVESI